MYFWIESLGKFELNNQANSKIDYNIYKIISMNFYTRIYWVYAVFKSNINKSNRIYCLCINNLNLSHPKILLFRIFLLICSIIALLIKFSYFIKRQKYFSFNKYITQIILTWHYVFHIYMRMCVYVYLSV